MIFEPDPLEVIAKFQADAPVNVDGIAQQLGLAVYRRPLGSNVSAAIQRDPSRGGRSGFAVYVNSTDVVVRQRFSLAHEIAHYVLHRDLIEQGVTDDTMYRSSELSGYHETQANRLAADILMPIRLVKREIGNINSAGLLARQFQVSRKSMEIRLTGMGVPWIP